jgi:hypothetical protein
MLESLAMGCNAIPSPDALSSSDVVLANKWKAHEGCITSLSVSRDDDYCPKSIFSCGEDKCAKAWNYTSGETKGK